MAQNVLRSFRHPGHPDRRSLHMTEAPPFPLDALLANDEFELAQTAEASSKLFSDFLDLLAPPELGAAHATLVYFAIGIKKI